MIGRKMTFDLIEQYRQIHNLFRDILFLASKQAEMIETAFSDLDLSETNDNGPVNDNAINLILAQRDDLAKSIEVLGTRIKDGHLAKDDEEEVNKLIKGITSIINEIQKNDAISRKFALSIHNELEKKIGSLQKNRQAVNAYNSLGIYAPVFLDKKK